MSAVVHTHTFEEEYVGNILSYWESIDNAKDKARQANIDLYNLNLAGKATNPPFSKVGMGD